MTIPAARQERNPLMDEAGWQRLQGMVQHPDAPAWNFEVGDRLVAADMEVVARWREAHVGAWLRPEEVADVGAPSAAVVAAVERLVPRMPWLRERIPHGLDLERDWVDVPTMDREDLAVRLHDIVPLDADLTRLISYDTSGTSGHAVAVPHDPLTLALAHVLLERVLAAWGVSVRQGPERVACVNVCAQHSTFVFANVFSVWQQAGFAKVNLRESEWSNGVEGARRFFAELDPGLISSDPISLAEMMRWNIEVRPDAILSTAVALTPGHRERIEQRYDCPVIDWYSTTETGVIAASAPDGDGLVVVPPDLHVESVDVDGFPVGPDLVGELTVTGGRNPYLPLIRYRTGDHGRVEHGPVTRIRDLQARPPVFFRASDGSLVNPVDVGRSMRMVTVLVQHEVIQRADGRVEVNLRQAVDDPGTDLSAIERALRPLFGAEAELLIRIDPTLAERSLAGKVAAYRSELEL